MKKLLLAAIALMGLGQQTHGSWAALAAKSASFAAKSKIFTANVGAWTKNNAPGLILSGVGLGVGQHYGNQGVMQALITTGAALDAKGTALEKRMDGFNTTVAGLTQATIDTTKMIEGAALHIGDSVGKLQGSATIIGNSVNLLNNAMQPALNLAEQFGKDASAKPGLYGMWSKAKSWDSELSSAFHMFGMITTLLAIIKAMPAMQPSSEQQVQGHQPHQLPTLSDEDILRRGRHATVVH